MSLAAQLLDIARSSGARSIVVVGTGKNVGKTVVVRALCDAANSKRVAFGLTSVGRDGEGFDSSDAVAKPRLLLHPGTTIATARQTLLGAPGCEILDFSDLPTAAGDLVYARVRTPAYYEIIGAPTAAGVRRVIERLAGLGCAQVIVDGAVDRLAALAGGSDAVIVATGAANCATTEAAVNDIRSLLRRLRIPLRDSNEAAIQIDGALTAERAAALISQNERRQIVVRDPTQIALSGNAFLTIAQRLDLRCERPLNVVAATVASIGRERYFEPREFGRQVAEATGLPTFDIYAGKAIAA
ncbi:MAG: hypothetical protein M3Y21_00170 [Candidatus Eremiobacteraeota bacterium]|nr:hypothetical protein [Candidatus Eremiobacteraeota bacterium]